ncbi:MAG TPA: hypothetical protein IAC36_07765 [Candidatus Aphodomonas merdavium]|nr:hypothetical protein [Candidatus Aphodomonas merdavium]
MKNRIVCLALAFVLLLTAAPAALAAVPEALNVDWDARHTWEELEGILQTVAETYPEITSLYPIGHSWQERSIWCMELTNESIAPQEKTGIAVLANIHGGERESAACAMYFLWWLATNATDASVAKILDEYIIYVVPVINPDGYDQSFVISTRENLRPRDLNGDGVPFSDPYTDLDGDGYIAYLFAGNEDDDMTWLTEAPSLYSAMRSEAYQASYIGRESPDWDGNGVLADDPRNSGIDLNRTFDYQWNRFDIETVDSEAGVIGANAFASAGPDAASEPEVQAVQQFLIDKDIDALATLHTGIQCVLYPWCYRPYDESIDSEDIPQMQAIAAEMAAAFQETTGRGFYSKSSYEDYPTSAELIDYAYGRLNIHAYTIEVYCGGKSATGDLSECYWENELPAPTLVYYTNEEVAQMGLDTASLGLTDTQGVWFYTTSSDQMVDKAPEDQTLMAEGCRDALLTMIESEPFGQGKIVPPYLQD